jgi:hypothetical protein
MRKRELTFMTKKADTPSETSKCCHSSIAKPKGSATPIAQMVCFLVGIKTRKIGGLYPESERSEQ